MQSTHVCVGVEAGHPIGYVPVLHWFSIGFDGTGGAFVPHLMSISSTRRSSYVLRIVIFSPFSAAVIQVSTPGAPLSVASFSKLVHKVIAALSVLSSLQT